MAHGLSNGHVTDVVTRPQKCCEEVRSVILATAWLLVLCGPRGLYLGYVKKFSYNVIFRLLFYRTMLRGVRYSYCKSSVRPSVRLKRWCIVITQFGIILK